MNYKLTYNKIILSVIITIAIILSSCKKDKVPNSSEDTNQCDECTSIPSGNIGVFDQYVLDTTYFTSPQFNPNNDNEIAFIEWSSGSKKLYKFNLITEQKILLFEGNFSGSHISWGANDWILLPLMDYQIWKIKSDGTQLTQVTSNGAWFHPEWNIDGDKFIAYHGYVDVNQYYAGKIWDGSGNIVDSFNWSPVIGDWNSSLGYGSVYNDRISVIDPITDDFVSDFNSGLTNCFSFNWITNEDALLTSVDGIFKYNIFSKSMAKIKCSCNSRIYSEGTVNSAGTKIIYSLSELSRLDGSTILDKSTLIIMDINGSNETVIGIN